MPLYEYRCETCNTRFERIERASAPAAGVCPRCQGPARRLLGTPALQFKGSGWYVTDYARGTGASTSAASTEAIHDAKGGSDGTLKTAPAKTPENDPKVA